METVVYTPQSELRKPFSLIKRMFHDLRYSWQLTWRLTVRDISAQYRLNFLGILWAFVPPVVSTFTFVLFTHAGLLNPGKDALPYAAYVLIGTVLWQLFADAVQAPLKIVNAARALLAKINFPRESLIFSALLQTIFNFLIKLMLVIGTMIWYKLPVATTILFLPIALASLLLLGFMIGLLLTPIGLLFNDVASGLSFLLTFWMLLTPVVYRPGQNGFLDRIGALNPVTPLLNTARDCLLNGSFASLGPFVIITTLCIFFLFIAWILYRVSLPILIERIGS